MMARSGKKSAKAAKSGKNGKSDRAAKSRPAGKRDKTSRSSRSSDHLDAAPTAEQTVAVTTAVPPARPPATPRPRSADEIGVTVAGPRPIPALTAAAVQRHPTLAQRVLDNGLTVIAVRKPGTPLVEVRLRIPFGGTTPTHTARAEVLAATLLLGTTTRTREQVDAELALVGGHLDASVDPQRLLVSGSVLSHGLPILLDVLAESLIEPAFRPRDVQGERDRIAEHLAIAASQPSVVARARLQERRFGRHPAAWDMPEAENVAKVGSAALRTLLAKSVVPAGSTLVLVGELSPARALASVETALAGWTTPGQARLLGTPPAVVGGPVVAFHRPGAVQSQVRLSAAALDRADPDYPAGQLANLIYGGYFSSRLVENIREDKGYTYSAHSVVEFWPGRSATTVSFDTTTPSTAAALLEARYELGRMALVPPAEAEVESARNYALGTLATSLATQAGYASTLSSLAGLGLDVEWLRAHPARLVAVTAAEVARVAATLLAPAAFTGVVVGDLETVADGLRALGEVEVA